MSVESRIAASSAAASVELERALANARAYVAGREASLSAADVAAILDAIDGCVIEDFARRLSE